MSCGCAIFAALVAGCGGSLAGKAGGGHEPGSTRVLAMAVADAGAGDRDVFASAVKRLSHGTLSVRIVRPVPPLALAQLDAERSTIARVERGELAMAWLPSRVWESEGVTGLRALWAPFVITSHTLLWKVVTSPIANDLLRDIRVRGVVGLALIPTDLRRFLGRDRPLVSLDAFRGARVATYSPTEAEVLRALGAVPELDERNISAALAAHRLDGVEVGGLYIPINGYTRTAPYVPANVVPFARTDVIAINAHVFAGLTPQQRAALRGGARAALAAQRDLAAQEDLILRGLCALGAKYAMASDAELARLERAERPVYDELRRDPEVRRYLVQIEAMKRRTPPEPPLAVPASCMA